MSQPNPDSLAASPCRDLSKYVGSPVLGVGSGLTGQYSNGPFGPRSTVTGIVVGIFGNLYYMEDATPTSPANQHRGITVFAPPTALVLGHKYVIAGASEEFYSENEFAAIQYVKDVGNPGVPTPIPMTVGVASLDTCDASQNITSGRDYLSELVKLSQVKVIQRYVTPTTTGFHVVGPAATYADTIYIENLNSALGANVANNPNYPPLGSLVNVTGVVHYTTNTSTPSFRICPRSAADITILGLTGVEPSGLELAFSVFPNPARTVNVAFTLPKSSDVELGVYDLLGRQVAHLASGRMPAGSYSRAWTGLDDAGKKVGSGVYFYRLRAGNEVRTARTMLLAN
jgi:flagellar hook assembly protein FlgD